MTRIARLLTLFALAAAVACGSDDDDEGAATPPTTAAPAPAGEVEPIAWDRLASGPHDLGDGWSLMDAEGDGPFVDILRNGARVGSIEIATYPLTSTPHLESDIASGGAMRALLAHARASADTFRTDRRASCGSSYPFESKPASAVDLADGTAVRYGFRAGRRGAGEGALLWAGVRGRSFVVVAVTAHDPDACTRTEGAEMDVATLDAVEPKLIAAVEAGALPSDA